MVLLLVVLDIEHRTHSVSDIPHIRCCLPRSWLYGTGLRADILIAGCCASVFSLCVYFLATCGRLSWVCVLNTVISCGIVETVWSNKLGWNWLWQRQPYMHYSVQINSLATRPVVTQC